MKLIEPVAPPGVRHLVKLKDGTNAVAFMAMGRKDVPDGTWMSHDGPVEAVEVVGPYRPSDMCVRPRF